MSEAECSGLVNNSSEEKLRKAYVEDGDVGAMFKLFQLYNGTDESEKSFELMDIYMSRGDYLWIERAKEAEIRRQKRQMDEDLIEKMKMIDRSFENGVQCERDKDYKSAAEFFFKACDDETARPLAFSHILDLTVKDLIDFAYLEKLFVAYNELLEETENRARSDADLSVLLGTLYYFDFEIIERDYDMASLFFWDATLKGRPDAQYYLGMMSEFGHGTKIDYDEALECYKMAYESGVEEALNGIERIKRLKGE